MRISSSTVFPSSNGGLFTSFDQSVDPCGDPVGLPEALAVVTCGLLDCRALRLAWTAAVTILVASATSSKAA